MQAHFDPTLELYPMTFTGLLQQCIIKHWSPATCVFMWVQFNFSLTGVICFWALIFTVHAGVRYIVFNDKSHVIVPFWWPLESAGFLVLATQCLVNYHMIPSVFPCWFCGSFSLILHNITLLGLKINLKLCLIGSNSSFYARLLSTGLNDLLFLLFFWPASNVLCT